MVPIRWAAYVCTVTAVATLAAGLLGCNGAAARRRLMSSGNPLDRARGAIEASDARDAAAVPQLVNLLEDPDQAVRMYAVLALRRLCADDFGYRYYADEPERHAAVERWRQELRAGKLALRPTTHPAAPGGASAADAGGGGTDKAPGTEARVQ